MKITEENVEQAANICPRGNVNLFKALLKDVKELNETTLPEIEKKLKVQFKFPRIFIGVQDWHDDNDEYPDYYGTLRIYVEGEKEDEYLEALSPELDLNGLDENLCTLVSYFDAWKEELEKNETKNKQES